MQYLIAGMFGGNFQSSAHMFGYQLACIFGCASVYRRVFTLVLQQIITYTASDKAFLYSRYGIYRAIDVEQRAMVGILIRTYLGMDAGRASATAAFVFIHSVHGIHIGTRSSQIAQITFEIRHFCNLFHFFQDAFLASADYELSLVGRNGTESTSAETSPVEIDGEFNHIISRDAFPFVFGMGQPGVWQVERHIQFALCHGRVGRIDHYGLVSHILQDAGSFVFIAFLFDEAEVFGLFLLIFQTLFMRVEDDIRFFYTVLG